MPRAFDRCVQHVKAKGGVGDPYAVCRASMGTDKEIMKKHKKPTKKKKGY